MIQRRQISVVKVEEFMDYPTSILTRNPWLDDLTCAEVASKHETEAGE